MSTSTILVLGATGTIGSKTLHELQSFGNSRVLAAVRSQAKAKTFTEQGIESVELDLDRPETLLPALQGVDRALLLTGYSVDMLRQSKRFLDAAKIAGVQHIVHIGASNAETNEVAHWGWHQYVEAYIEEKGFSYTHLRPEAFMQNIISPAYRWLDKDTIHHYVGNARWSWVDADDLALVAARVLHEPEKYQEQIIPLGYDAKTFDEIADLFSEVTGQQFYAQAHPPEEFLQNAINAGADVAYMTCVYNQFKLNIAGAIPNADATYNNFEVITGRKPTTWRQFAQKHRQLIEYPTFVNAAV